MYKVIFAGHDLNTWPTFSTIERAWDYIESELRDEAQDNYDHGVSFDYDYALSFYDVVPTFLKVVK